LDDVIFVLCEFTLHQKRVPGAYRGFYVRYRRTKTSRGESINPACIN